MKKFITGFLMAGLMVAMMVGCASPVVVDVTPPTVVSVNQGLTAPYYTLLTVVPVKVTVPQNAAVGDQPDRVSLLSEAARGFPQQGGLARSEEASGDDELGSHDSTPFSACAIAWWLPSPATRRRASTAKISGYSDS